MHEELELPNRPGLSLDQKVPRRAFVSMALLAASVTAVHPKITGKTINTEIPDLDDNYLIPGPADTLTVYLDEIEKVRYDILRQYYVIFGFMAAVLRRKYEALRKDIDELMRLAPELKVDKNLCRLRDVAAASKNNITASNTPDPRLVAVIKTNFELALIASNQVSREEVKWSASEISPEAIEKIKDILCRIDNLNTPTASIQDASTELSKSDGELTTEIKSVVSAVREAINLLLRNESNAAILKLESAISQLNALDKYKPSKKLLDYIEGLPEDIRIEYAKKNKSVTTPTSTAQELLQRAIAWIKVDGRFPNDQSLPKISGAIEKGQVEFIRISANLTAPVGIRFFTILASVLGTYLPHPTPWRIGSCSFLLCPILFAYSDENIRIQKIKDMFYSIIPSGEFDTDDARTTAAAKILAKIII